MFFYLHFVNIVNKKTQETNLCKQIKVNRSVSMSQLKPFLVLHLTPIKRLLLPWPRESTHLGVGFLLRCFQQLSSPHLATQRVPLIEELVRRTWLEELVHQRCVLPGPLVLWKAPLNALPLTPDMDRTVSRRSEPSSRTAFMGEQPNPWDVLPPQVATSRHRGAKPSRRCELLGKISLLSLE